MWPIATPLEPEMMNTPAHPKQTLLNIATMQYHVGIRRCLKVTRGYMMVFGYRKALFSSQNFSHATVLRTLDH